MKIDSLTIRGFRGFNDERIIGFDDRLTLIYAPNSYGKTSISEALEWLLYGSNSRVEKAVSKEEFKGSSRNCHLPDGQHPYILAGFKEGDRQVVLRADMKENDEIERTLDGVPVERWPAEYTPAQKPFVLQHALKYLLWVGPDERFRGFAGLLGFEELDSLQKNIDAFCTKPEVAYPNETRQLISKLARLEDRLKQRQKLSAIAKSYTKGLGEFEETYDKIDVECRRRIGGADEGIPILTLLKQKRDDLVGREFDGRIELTEFARHEVEYNSADEKYLVELLSKELVCQYGELQALALVEGLLKRAEFHAIGLELLEKDTGKCPFCQLPLGEEDKKRVYAEHERLVQERAHTTTLTAQKSSVKNKMEDLWRRLRAYHERQVSKTVQMLALEPRLPRLDEILGKKSPVVCGNVRTCVSELSAARKTLEGKFENVKQKHQLVMQSIASSTEKLSLLEDLVQSLADHVGASHVLSGKISAYAALMKNASELLVLELDALAGTEDIGVLVDLLERKADVRRKMEVDSVVSSLKDLKKSVGVYVADKTLSAISQTLTNDVLEWYNQVKTTGDPDVHFFGFDVDRTADGRPRPRRIRVRAKSYGKELVSAVSSLSESKLNALGLCISISANLSAISPFEFIIIDDPVQSWDEAHESQFSEVVRRLAADRKQVILLTHHKPWANTVRSICRSLNGVYYEITGYSKAGPEIRQLPWAPWKQRLQEVLAITTDSGSDSVALQRAEAEIRTAIEDITSDLYRRRKNTYISCRKLNADGVRQRLVECGIDTGLCDRISSTFETTDPAHHAQTNYSECRERIRCYHSWVHELAQVL